MWLLAAEFLLTDKEYCSYGKFYSAVLTIITTLSYTTCVFNNLKGIVAF